MKRKLMKTLGISLASLIAIGGTTYAAAYYTSEKPQTLDALVIEGANKLQVLAGDQAEQILNQYVVAANDEKNVTIKMVGFDSEKLGVQKVKIVAENQNGSKTEKTVTIEVVEKTAQISGEDLKVKAGEAVDIKQGIVATGRKEGDLTSEVTTEGEVNWQVAGSYPITYKVKNKAGKTTSYTRTIVVEAAPEKAVQPVVEKTEEAEVADAVAPATSENNQPAARTAQVAGPNTLTIAGTVISYTNVGNTSAQSVIDNAPHTAATWSGAVPQSGEDGMNTLFVGHDYGAFGALFSLSIGSTVVVTDGNGTPTNYTVTTFLNVNDDGYAADGTDYYYVITGSGGGERITMQTCNGENNNLIVIAEAR